MIAKHSDIWEDTGEIINLLNDEHIKINLNTDWNSLSAPKSAQKIYPLGAPDRDAVDKEFDKLHMQGQMGWSTDPTPFSWPVFVVWKTVYEGPEKVLKRKPRVVVNIQGLNKIATTDLYPLPLQADVISLLQGMGCISILDGLSFFLQFGVWPEDWHKQTVASHCGLEFFKVAAMGYKGSPPYVQCIMDRELRPLKEFVKAYIDELVAFLPNF